MPNLKLSMGYIEKMLNKWRKMSIAISRRLNNYLLGFEYINLVDKLEKGKISKEEAQRIWDNYRKSK